MKIVKYIILYNIMWGISITMCYFHRFIDDINYSLQDFLITFFELLAWIVLYHILQLLVLSSQMALNHFDS